ncbi:heparan-alpha-glucosaminide N-acetyltransferase domain-containing protein [Microbacterium sp. Leaf159]|uniref:heparan-alpha-glucosaminide N-acetyltransferase domain-containing protein n=1 Tax=Microbacterium sp. Leaf159 TaxID=1736279 RepID=UPI0006FE487F|nr:heparan-alpha-glucosaminide N-acetyltransferase domain-containing protein [Microbacterium sp. Leaf159]KQR36433.1 hypothetical protein ASF80_18060 [Microbacterium sp. Leaf159]
MTITSPSRRPHPARVPDPSAAGGLRRSDGIRSRLRAFGKHPRLMGVDAARGLAVLGMLGAHLGLGAAGFDWATPATWGDAVNGRSAILFAIVAGVSLALMTRGLDRDDADAVRAARLRLIGRGLAVFAIGIVLELLGTHIAVILTIYGLLFVIAAPLLTWRTRSLAIGAVVSAVLVPAALATMNVLSADVIFGPGVSFALVGIYPVPVWITFLLIGLAVGRMPLHRVRVQLALLGLGAVLATAGYGAAALALPSTPPAESMTSSSVSSDVPSGSAEGGLPGMSPADQFDFDGLSCQADSGVIVCADPDEFAGGADAGEAGDYWEALWASDPLGMIGTHWMDASPHSSGALEIIGSGGLAMAVLALMLLAARPLRWVLIPLAALGAMPLTAYAAHVVLFVNGWFTSLFEEPVIAWGVASVGLLVLTTMWALLVGRGPLERLTAWAGAAFTRESRAGRHAAVGTDPQG